MIAIGIDPGTARVGYGIIKKEYGKITFLDAGILKVGSAKGTCFCTCWMKPFCPRKEIKLASPAKRGDGFGCFVQDEIVQAEVRDEFGPNRFCAGPGWLF